ncbi:related to 3-oxoacyl-[acyl-carrier protein] reductase [Serendipita indica DSM 11827]|uniref:Related to 3-oxoacyl-[acyl-carrier protein] reductase n=1 Tax=Serendipita indica (strain DSM 11827) TaxID=1109443 RepID=G4TN34_SERID|nr:related to 3-oxoacyl-[acyl-carrier protein] reductase [Serendipita indica DSM 11827]
MSRVEEVESRRKVAIVTGASSGIGRITSVALCEAGWNVVLSARRKDALEETARMCEEAARDQSVQATELTLVVAGDVTQESDVHQLFERSIATYGRIDMLFNNAGITGPSKPLEDISLADFMAVMNTNLVAAMLCTQHALRYFKQNASGGRIINNGSIAAHAPRPHGAPYAISKHAIWGLTKSTQLEGRSFGVTCTQLDIGNAMTQMAQGAATTGALQPDGSVKVEGSIDARHVARAVVHIAGLPTSVTVLQMNIMATDMPYIGRG